MLGMGQDGIYAFEVYFTCNSVSARLSHDMSHDTDVCVALLLLLLSSSLVYLQISNEFIRLCFLFVSHLQYMERYTAAKKKMF